MTNILIELRKIRISGVEMGYRELAKSIPATMRELLAERLMDVMLEAKDGSRVPSSIAKTILFYWQREQLASEARARPNVRSAINLFGLEVLPHFKSE